MRLLIAALLSAGLIWSVPNAEAQTLNKQVAPTTATKIAKSIPPAQPQPEPKAEAPQPVVEQVPVAPPEPPPVAASVGNCGDNMYKQYIYQHESGCNTDRYNSIGCYGIGQACPASKVKDQCGADFACQDAWFSNYAIQRYGSWEGAYYAWQRQHWW